MGCYSIFCCQDHSGDASHSCAGPAPVFGILLGDWVEGEFPVHSVDQLDAFHCINQSCAFGWLRSCLCGEGHAVCSARAFTSDALQWSFHSSEQYSSIFTMASILLSTQICHQCHG